VASDGQRHRLSGGGRPVEAPLFLTAVVEPEAAGIPEPDLQLVPLAVAEDKPGRAYQLELAGPVVDGGGVNAVAFAECGIAESTVSLGL